jgi:hypothetical protein
MARFVSRTHNSQSDVPHPSPGEANQPRRCKVEGRARATVQGGGYRQHHRDSRPQRHRRSRSVRLLKRDLQFLLNQIAPLLDEWRLQTLARQHGIRKDRETDAIGKLFAAFVRRADEGTLSRLLVEATILLAAARTNPAVVLREAASTYKVDTDAIALKVKQEFAAKEKSRKEAKAAPSNAVKKRKAA